MNEFLSGFPAGVSSLLEPPSPAGSNPRIERRVWRSKHIEMMLYFFDTNPMQSYIIDLTWLCLILSILVAIGFAIFVVSLSIPSRVRYAKRIFDAQARGAFDDMNTPKQKTKIRWLALSALVGVIGATSSLILLFFTVQRFGPGTLAFDIALMMFAFFGILGTIAGLMMQREIDRRL